MYVPICMEQQFMIKEAINLKGSKEGYMGESNRGKGGRELCNYVITSKVK